jgi:hypothetical protein
LRAQSCSVLTKASAGSLSLRFLAQLMPNAREAPASTRRMVCSNPAFCSMLTSGRGISATQSLCTTMAFIAVIEFVVIARSGHPRPATTKSASSWR